MSSPSPAAADGSRGQAANATFRLLAALCVGVAHFLLALMLGPGLGYRCASAGDCVADLANDFPAKAVFEFPLSLAGSHLRGVLHDYSFPFFAAINALAIALLLWAALSLLARWRAPVSQRR